MPVGKLGIIKSYLRWSNVSFILNTIDLLRVYFLGCISVEMNGSILVYMGWSLLKLGSPMNAWQVNGV